jgi:hypothetical protein
LSIATLVFDASEFDDEFHTLNSAELQQLIMSKKSLWYWIHNRRYIDAFPKIIEDTKRQQKSLSEAIAKAELERQKALEKHRKRIEIESQAANTKFNSLKNTIEDWRVKHYRETGKFARQNPETGKREICELCDIKPNRFSSALVDYDAVMFETKLEEAFSGRTDVIILLIHKLYSATPDEQEIFRRIYERYVEMPVNEELVRKIDIMHHIINESMI